MREPTTPRSQRLLPIDWTRGLVMILMAVDHASGVLNRGRVTPGSRNLTAGATSFPPDQFFLRWITHVCPVAFVFLAGCSISMLARQKAARGATRGEIGRFITSRGLVILLIDIVWLNLLGGYENFRLDVLTAIGSAMMVLGLLRHLRRPALAVLALGLILTPELFGSGVLPAWAARILYEGGPASPSWFIQYPIAPWIGVMVVGFLWGEFVLDPSHDEATALIRLTHAALRTLVPLFALFVALRAANGFGNAGAPRLDDSLQQWLNVSKNPPSLAFLGLEFAILGLFLAAFAWAQRQRYEFRALTVFGQTALFFYMLHFYVLILAAMVTATMGKLGIPGALLGAALLVLAMYPLCRWYQGYKRRHDNWLTRYV
ncbi:MAG: heparan-alpha-glucosaminide N-acetyltransferase domain-containing protein [Myxococcales bacterium]